MMKLLKQMVKILTLMNRKRMLQKKRRPMMIKMEQRMKMMRVKKLEMPKIKTMTLKRTMEKMPLWKRRATQSKTKVMMALRVKKLKSMEMLTTEMGRRKNNKRSLMKLQMTSKTVMQ